MFAPQYPDGLRLDIYSYKLRAGTTGQDVKEINVLNHYIGMRDLVDRRLHRVQVDAVRGRRAGPAVPARRRHGHARRTCVDVLVLYVYFAAFALWSFGYKMYGVRAQPRAHGGGEGGPVHAAAVRLQAAGELRGLLVPGGGSYAMGAVRRCCCSRAFVRGLAAARACGGLSRARRMAKAACMALAWPRWPRRQPRPRSTRHAPGQLEGRPGRRAASPLQARSMRRAPGRRVEVAAGSTAATCSSTSPLRLVGRGRPRWWAREPAAWSASGPPT